MGEAFMIAGGIHQHGRCPPSCKVGVQYRGLALIIVDEINIRWEVSIVGRSSSWEAFIIVGVVHILWEVSIVGGVQHRGRR